MAYFLFRIWLAWVRLSSPQAISAIPSLDIYRTKTKKKGTTRVPFSNQIFSHLTDFREQP